MASIGTYNFLLRSYDCISMITENASHIRNIQTYISCSRIVGLFSFRVHWNCHWLRHDIIKWINGTIVPLWDSEVDSKRDIWYSKQFDELATYIQLSQFEIGDRSRDIERTKQLWFLKEVGSTKAGFHCMLKIPHWFFHLMNTCEFSWIFFLRSWVFGAQKTSTVSICKIVLRRLQQA